MLVNEVRGYLLYQVNPKAREIAKLIITSDELFVPQILFLSKKKLAISKKFLIKSVMYFFLMYRIYYVLRLKSKDFGIFDSKFYKNSNEDLKDLKISSWKHFQTFGINENRNINALLDVNFVNEHLWNQKKVSLEELLLNPKYAGVKPSLYFKKIKLDNQSVRLNLLEKISMLNRNEFKRATLLHLLELDCYSYDLPIANRRALIDQISKWCNK